GWRELAVLGDKIEKFSCMLEGFIWSPRNSEANDRFDDWAFEEVIIRKHFLAPSLLASLTYSIVKMHVGKGPHFDFTGPNSGSTACVVVIRGNKLVVANDGDSRCVLSRKGQ
ncbi:unnamed protein product, partial [Sphenostylis stenocarpa]